MTNQDIIPQILRFEQFEPLLEQNFELEFSDETFSFTLIEARLSSHPYGDPATRPAFSLQFFCRDKRILPQLIHRMWHASLGHQDIFCVPIGMRDEGVLYEAVFN
jgi:hypothetical protein